MKISEYKKDRYSGSGYDSLLRDGRIGFNTSYSERNESFKGTEFSFNKGREYNAYPEQWSPETAAEKKKQQSPKAQARQLGSLITRSVAVLVGAVIIVSADPKLTWQRAEASSGGDSSYPPPPSSSPEGSSPPSPPKGPPPLPSSRGDSLSPPSFSASSPESLIGDL